MKSVYKLMVAMIVPVFLMSCSSFNRTGKVEVKKADAKWWKTAVCYEIYIRSFNDSNGDGIGDINGITQKLDYLKSLGVNVIWITPFYPTPDVDMGYDISDYKNVDPRFGTLEDFDNLIKEAHKRDIKIQTDMVFSHTSDQHPWFKEAIKSKDNPFHDFYFFEPEKEPGKYPNDWMSWFSGHAWSLNKATNEYYLHIFAKQQPALNWKNPKVRKEMESVAKFWLDRGVDGLRFDVITLIGMPDITQSSDLWGTLPIVHKYLGHLNKNVLSKYDIMTVGEMPGVNAENAWEYVNPKTGQLDTIFQLDIMGGVDQVDNKKFEPADMDLLKFKSIYEKWYEGLHNRGWNSVVLGNHDQARVVSRWGNDKEYWKESGKMLSTFLLTQWGTPYIFAGDEIGMINCPFTRDEFRDVEEINYYNEQIKAGKKEAEFMPGLLARCRDNARTPMQWSNEKNGGFTTSDSTWIKVNPSYKTINVEDQINNSDSILNYYKELIKYRKANQVLALGDYEQLDPNNSNVFAYYRFDDNNKLLIINNFKGKESTINTNISGLDKYNVEMSNYEKHNIDSDGVVKLQPYESVIIKLK